MAVRRRSACTIRPVTNSSNLGEIAFKATRPRADLPVGMTDAAICERVSGIRAELLDLIGHIGGPATRLELSADMMLDDLLVVANRLGRVAEGLQGHSGTGLD